MEKSRWVALLHKSCAALLVALAVPLQAGAMVLASPELHVYKVPEGSYLTLRKAADLLAGEEHFELRAPLAPAVLKKPSPNAEIRRSMVCTGRFSYSIYRRTIPENAQFKVKTVELGEQRRSVRIGAFCEAQNFLVDLECFVESKGFYLGRPTPTVYPQAMPRVGDLAPLFAVWLPDPKAKP